MIANMSGIPSMYPMTEPRIRKVAEPTRLFFDTGNFLPEKETQQLLQARPQESSSLLHTRMLPCRLARARSPKQAA